MTMPDRRPDLQPGVPQEVEGGNILSFNEMLERRQSMGLNICFGIDPDLERYKDYFDIPKMDTVEPWGELSVFLYDRAVEYIEATAEFAAVYKPNASFYEQHGLAGAGALYKIMDYMREKHPEIPVIGDVKRGEIGNSQDKNAKAAFGYYRFNAATVNPYMSGDAVLPFAKYRDRGTFVLVRTSNEDAKKTQDVIMQDGRPYWQHMADLCVKEWNGNKNIGVVIGATNPQELVEVRSIVGPEVQILAPGVGTQGGTVRDVVKGSGSNRFVINVSRSHLYPKLHEGETLPNAINRVSKKLHEEIQEEKAA